MLRGEVVLFGAGPPEQDDVLSALISPVETLDLLTKQALELLFKSFCLVSSRQIKDYIPGGLHSAPTDVLRETTVSVPTTNVGPERTFGMLDSMLRLMPRASTIAVGKFFLVLI